MIDIYTDRFSALVARATLGQIEDASTWYNDAENVAREVAENLNVSVEAGASVVSAFSPRERWASNVSKAIAFSLGLEVRGLPNNIRMANEAITHGFDALRGPKTNAFARAIAGDEDAIVIDIWMMRAALVDSDSPNKTQYREMSEAVSVIARKTGMTNRTIQALIWIVIRGSAI
jgi:hypothetical protein